MDRTRKLVLVGGGGTSADALTIIAAINTLDQRYEVVGLLDDTLSVGSMRWGVRVLGGLDTTCDHDVRFVDCLGSPRSFRGRESLYDRLGLDTKRFETLVHPAAIVASDVKIGDGSILYPNTVVLSGVQIGSHVTILSGSVLNHEVQVGDWSILASGVMVSGGVQIGRSCYLGAGGSIREGVVIGNGSMIAMGAAVTSNVATSSTVGGVPARPLRTAR